MPTAAARPCRHPGCRHLASSGNYCTAHRREHHRQYDAERGSAAARGYNSRWRKARETYLRRCPLCVHCTEQARTTPATVVDHIVPHKGDSMLFWDTANWQALCKPCHDRWKQRAEREQARDREGASKVQPPPP